MQGVQFSGGGGARAEPIGAENHVTILGHRRMRDNGVMKPLVWVLLAVLTPAATAQMKLTVEQLLTWVRSSRELKHEDKKVAEYLRKVILTERLDERTIEQLQGEGVGPKTLEALRLLSVASTGLDRPTPPASKPPPVPIPPPGAEEQKHIIEEAREYALGYTKRLPDFICTQVIRRHIDPTGLEFWQRQDVVVARLSFFEQKEEYKVIMVNDRPSEVNYHSLGGAVSSGEFGSMLKYVFDPETEAEFRWDRWATLRGRRMHVYAYRVTEPKSKWGIEYERTLRITPGYSGLVYVDRDTRMVAKLTYEADGIPPSFPIQRAASALDYDYVTIGPQQHMLPLKYEMRMRQGKFLVKNEAEFRMYRKFGAEATIKFETPDPISEEQTREKPPRP